MKAKIIKSMLVPILGISTVAASMPVATGCAKKVNPSDQVVHVTSITANNPNIKLIVQETEKLSFTILPEKATNKNVTWKSSNSDVAFINVKDNEYWIVAKSAGQATITLTTIDGEFHADYTIVVDPTVDPTPVSSIDLDTKKVNMPVGETFKLTATVLPEEATNKKVTWESSKPEIATVDQNGNITALKPGEATITCLSLQNTSVQKTCEVRSVGAVLTIDGVESTEEEPIELSINNSKQIDVKILPESYTQEYILGNPTWTSSSSRAFSVDKNGLVTATLPINGSITISYDFKTTQQSKFATAKITGTCYVQGKDVRLDRIVINPPMATIDSDETYQFTLQYVPEDASNKKVTWASSDTSIATVDENGKVTPVPGPGFTGTKQVTITATPEATGESVTATLRIAHAG